MPLLQSIRARVGIRRRIRDPVAVKHRAQLRWWVEVWDPVVRGGGHNPGDVLELLGEGAVDPDYWGRRWQIARAQVERVQREAQLDPDHFGDKAVVEVGPGLLGFPDACPARTSIGVEPLAQEFACLELLLPDSPAVYITSSAEDLPLVTDSADVVVVRCTLEFVDDPKGALKEFRRILRPEGDLILLFDVDHVPTPAVPNALTTDWVKSQLIGLNVVREHHWAEPMGIDGHRVVLVAHAPAT